MEPDLPLSFRLLEVVEGADISEISRLLDAGANPNIRDIFSGYTCLHVLASVGRVDAVQLLINSGADPNITTQNTSASPLGGAAIAGRIDVVNLLISNGARLSESEKASNLLDECREYGETEIADIIESTF